MKIRLRPSAKKNGSKSPTTATRKALAAKGEALPDNSFPVPNRDFLKRGIQSLGRTPPEKRPQVVAFLRKRAKALGATDLLSKGALAMSHEEYASLLELAGDLASEGNSGTTAGGKNMTTPANSASDGPRVTSQGAKTAEIYKKLRKKGLSNKQAAAMAKRAANFSPKGK
jgi:hypothetical protein